MSEPTRQPPGNPTPPDEPKLLPDPAHAQAVGAVVVSTPVNTPQRQLAEVPLEELQITATELGLDPARFKTRQDLVTAIHMRRQLIASMNRDAMADVLLWARRPAIAGASKEALAHQIVGIRSMRFAGLSQRGLVVLAALRGVEVRGDEPVPALIKALKKQEGFFAKMNRKRRAVLGSIVSNIMGEEDEPSLQVEERHAPGDGSARTSQASIRHEIEDAGLFGGLAGRIKKSTDSYLNQKLDEIESRIDRKLDEIDRRLAEWRDKEVANRIRILKITLWASVTVGAFSLIYSYVQVYLPDLFSHSAKTSTVQPSTPSPSSQPATQQAKAS